MIRGTVIACTKRHHGLGNRLRVVLGARSLARWAGRDFGYVWSTGSSFGSDLDELWQFGEHRISALRSRLLTPRHPYRDHTLAWLPQAADDLTWQIRTAHALHLPAGARPWGEELQSLAPASAIAERVTSFSARHLGDGPYIGVMVRAHAISNKKTLELSPLSWYVDRMRQLRTERPGIRFFLSADTPDAQTEVVSAIPGTVALNDKGAYNSKAALLSSVVDLYLLAGSAHLIAPHYSSFPEVAQQLAGPALRLETSMTTPEARLEAHDELTRVSDPLRPSVRKFAGS